MSDIPSIDAVDVKLQYCHLIGLRVWVTKHAANAARVPFTTAKRRQHLRAARAVNDKQEEAMKVLARAHNSLKKAHNLQVHQAIRGRTN